VQPDHYVFRMLYSQGISMEDLGIGQKKMNEDDPRIWIRFAESYYLFRGTPTRMWLDYAFQELFGLEERLSAATPASTTTPSAPGWLLLSLPSASALRSVQHRSAGSTTNSPLDPLTYHQAIRDSGWKARILPTFRPDSVVDPEFDGFRQNVQRLGEMHGEDCSRWKGYLNALCAMPGRAFRSWVAPQPITGIPRRGRPTWTGVRAAALFIASSPARPDAEEQELFRAQMLTEMARMSVEDGLVMQIHPGSVRNHNRQVFRSFGRDMGADIPDADRLMCTRCSRCWSALATMKNADHHSVHAGRIHDTAASWRRWPAIIRACALARRGGFTTALRA
jgi:glucuronate isomerase